MCMYISYVVNIIQILNKQIHGCNLLHIYHPNINDTASMRFIGSIEYIFLCSQLHALYYINIDWILV